MDQEQIDISKLRKNESEHSFALRLALVNFIGFCAITCVPTYFDPLLNIHNTYPVRHYPLGYWIITFGFLISIINYFSVRYISSWKLRSFLPGLSLFVIGCLCLFYFMLGFHLGVFIWISLYSSNSILASVLRYMPIHISMRDLCNSSIAKISRVERIKEGVAFWRTFSISIIFGFLAVLLFYVKGMWDKAPNFIGTSSNQTSLITARTIELFVFTFCIIAGSITESLKRMTSISELFWKIPESEDQINTNGIKVE